MLVSENESIDNRNFDVFQPRIDAANLPPLLLVIRLVDKFNVGLVVIV